MKISKTAKAGTLESNDIFIMVSPSESEGVTLELQSIVLAQFGRQIRETILKAVAAKGVTRPIFWPGTGAPWTTPLKPGWRRRWTGRLMTRG